MPVRKQSRRGQERKELLDITRQMFKDPRLRMKLTNKHPRMKMSVVIEEDEKKEVFDVTPQIEKKSEWNPEEALKILDSLYGKAIEIGEDPQELEDIAERNYKWRTIDSE